MENASKALLIAGAILIAIVLITFGVIILGQGSEIINSSSLSETEIATFNSKFTSYEGKKVRGSKVNSLLQAVVQNNVSQEDEAKKVTVNSGTGEGIYVTTDGKSNAKADTGKTYEVECSYANTGLIEDIGVTETSTN